MSFIEINTYLKIRYSITEIITSHDYGLLVEPGDSNDLAEKIESALEKKWAEEKIIEYVEQYQWTNIAEEILQVYGNI